MTKSALDRIWNRKNIDENFTGELARSLKISDLLARILSTRIESVEQAMLFLDPKIKSLLPDPFHLLDMDKAVDRTIKAIKAGEKICIFADYDVDGATSSALIKNVLYEIGVGADIYVPDRIAEGYGPSAEAMKKIRDNGTKLLITVDCGAVAFDALAHAKELGLDVIVIDHHISMDTLPEAVAVVNPNRLDESSKYKNLAAVGVSFLFAVALCSKLKQEGFFNKNKVNPPDLIKQLDIVALGTVCDVMLLTGLNRAFVSQGLKIARQRHNIGYRTLADIAEINEIPSCYHLGFILGPRINAGGRVGKSSLGAKLLSTKSQSEAHQIAMELQQHNDERKVLELDMLEQADQIAMSQINDPLLFIIGKGWHPGVIGIVAGRMKDKYNKPVAVIALNNGQGKASCRSVRGTDFGYKIIEAKNRELLINGGGHAMAAGFTAAENKLTELHDFLKEQFAKELENSTAHVEEHYDMELTTKGATIELINEISQLEPFGNGNPTPIFKFPDLYVLKADIIKEKHIRVTFAPTKQNHSSTPLAAIGFNIANTKMAEILMSSKPHNLSAIGTIKINRWHNKDNIQLQLKDVIVE